MPTKPAAYESKTLKKVMAFGNDPFDIVIRTAAVTVVVLGLYASSFYSYILFHGLIELTTIAIGFTLFTLTLNARRFFIGGCLKALGIGYGLIALVDLLHSLAYKGMGFFPGYDANLPTQLWIAARFLQAILLCVAPLFARRNLNHRVFFGISLATVSVGTALVWSGAFPDCFIEGTGLTPFKIVSEYVISALLLVALFLFIGKRTAFNTRVFTFIAASILCTIGSELAFTSYVSVYGPANMVGHFLKLAAFYLIYRALVVTGFQEPFELIFRDLKQAEKALTQEREFSRCLLESMADGVVACGADGILTLFNRSAREWHGMDPLRLPPDEWAHHFDLFRPDGITPLLTDEVPLARAFRGEIVRDAGMAIKAKGQPIRFLLANGSVIRDEAGQKLGAVVVMRDVTEFGRLELELRKANEELEQRVEERTAELRASEGKYHSLFESANDVVFIHEIRDNMPGPFLEVNEVACRLLGYTREEFARMSPMELDDPRYHDRITTAMERLLQDGQVVFETAHVTRDGRSIPVEVSSRITEIRGRQLLVSIARDLSERKRAEQERLAHLWFMESMDAINQAMQGAHDLERMMSDVLDVVLSTFACDRAFLLYPGDPESETWSVPMERNRPEYPGVCELGIEMPMYPAVAETLRILIAADCPVTFGPGTSHAVPPDVTERFGVKCFMAMAIYPKVGKPWQFGIHQCSHARVWTMEEVHLFQEIGRRLADSMASLLMYRDLRKSEQRYRMVFENSPVSIWEEDFSGVQTFFDGMKKNGVTDIEQYLDRHPDAVRNCAELAKVTDVNRAALTLHGAASKEELFAGLVNAFTPESLDIFRQELVCLWNGGTEMVRDAVVKTLAGESRHVTVYFSVCPGYEGTLAKILVSLADISSRKQAEEAVMKLNEELDRRVHERTAELEKTNKELQKLNKLFVGRELRMVGLKEKIRELEKKNGA
jgi:PAS domain S-box-containing protein